MFETWPVRIMCVYFVGHILMRSVLPIPIGYDEGEQFIVTQEFALGYGAQPPLYNWLQGLCFYLFGVNGIALTILKQSILLGIFLAVYALWRKVGLSVAVASACTFSLFMLNEVGWELQRTRTHLSLAVLLAASFALVSVTIFRESKTRSHPRSRQFILYGSLGILLGLGVLAKYNFIVFPVGMVLAGLISKEFRQSILTPWSLVAVFTAVIIVSPHMFWLMENRDWIAGDFTKRFGEHDSDGSTIYLIPGLVQAGKALSMFYLMPLIIGVLILLDWRDWNVTLSNSFKSLDQRSRNLIKTIAVASIAAMGLIFVVAIGSGMTEIRNRWLVPAAFLSVGPLLLQTRILVGPNTRRFFWIVVLILMFTIVIAIAQEACNGFRAKGDFENLPVIAGPTWEAAIESPGRNAVIINDQRVAGIIRTIYPNVLIVAPNYSIPNLQSVDQILVIVELRNGAFPPDIAELLATHFPDNSLGALYPLDATGLPNTDRGDWNIARLK